MNDTPATTPEPDELPQSEPVATKPEPAQESAPAVADEHAPSTAAKLSITVMFVVLGLVGAWAGWTVQSDFVREATPLAPSGMPGEGQLDSEFTLHGFEVIMAAMGVPAKQSTFNILLGADEIDSGPVGTSPDPQQVMAQMKEEAKRSQKEISPRRNRVAVYLLLLGIPLGAGIGLAEGIRRRSILHLLAAPVACAILTGAAGFLAGGLHARVAMAVQPIDLRDDFKLMIPNFVAWLVIGLGAAVWPLAMSPTAKALKGIGSAVIASALLNSLIYGIIAQAIFIDDDFKFAIPGHVYSFMFWFLFGSGCLCLLLGLSCANMGRQRPQPAA